MLKKHNLSQAGEYFFDIDGKIDNKLNFPQYKAIFSANMKCVRLYLENMDLMKNDWIFNC